MNSDDILTLPLEGVRVLDMSEVWAGPMACTLLADLGASVIKLESFPRPSLTRMRAQGIGHTKKGLEAPRPWDRAALNNLANRNKIGITLNIRHPDGKRLFHELVSISDVVTESMTAGTAARLGISYNDLKVLRPDIIILSTSGWGTLGPYQGYAALGAALDGFSGHHALRGYPDTDPTMTTSVQHTDSSAALMGSFAILAALHYRNRSGNGQWIDLSQSETFLPHLGSNLMDYTMNHRFPHPVGNKHQFHAPYGCYQCSGEDDWVVIHITSHDEWISLCEITSNRHWIDDPRFSDPINRHNNQDLLDQELQLWTSVRDKFTIMHMLQNAGVPAQAVLDDVNVYNDPHLNDREFFNTIDHKVIGKYQYPGFPWKMTRRKQVVHHGPNSLGEHNQDVYGDLLGLSDSEIEYLKAEGVIGDTFPPDRYAEY
ncbi:CoA transferase [SAR202 cluster bacterium AD-804-J14_MRT_500m]|nr:CoA transferase [SAR202 cluster bacterium AD-804-J14_MRT_500m]